jgi:hypothetical protein
MIKVTERRVKGESRGHIRRKTPEHVIDVHDGALGGEQPLIHLVDELLQLRVEARDGRGREVRLKGVTSLAVLLMRRRGEGVADAAEEAVVPRWLVASARDLVDFVPFWVADVELPRVDADDGTYQLIQWTRSSKRDAKRMVPINIMRIRSWRLDNARVFVRTVLVVHPLYLKVISPAAILDAFEVTLIRARQGSEDRAGELSEGALNEPEYDLVSDKDGDCSQQIRPYNWRTRDRVAESHGANIAQVNLGSRGEGIKWRAAWWDVQPKYP